MPLSEQEREWLTRQIDEARKLLAKPTRDFVDSSFLVGELLARLQLLADAAGPFVAERQGGGGRG